MFTIFFGSINLRKRTDRLYHIHPFLACPGACSAWAGTFSTGGEQNLFDTGVLGLGGTDQL